MKKNLYILYDVSSKHLIFVDISLYCLDQAPSGFITCSLWTKKYLFAKILKILLPFFFQPVPLITHTGRQFANQLFRQQLPADFVISPVASHPMPFASPLTGTQCNWKPLQHRQLGSADCVLGARPATLGTRCSSVGFDWRSYSSCLVCVAATVWATFNFSFHFSSWSASHVNGCKITELNKVPECKSQSEAKYETKSSRVESGAHNKWPFLDFEFQFRAYCRKLF